MARLLITLILAGCTVPIEPGSPDLPEAPGDVASEGEGEAPPGGGQGDVTPPAPQEGEGEPPPPTPGEGEGEPSPVGEGEGEVCVPGPELCNQIDDDCDGEVDERDALEASGFVGISCGDGLGACEAGSVECVDGELGCVGMVLPGPEECNGIDDDCDGEVDEADPGAGADCGLETGECSFGVTACKAGAIECDGGTGPSDERCDGLDNDCDGQVDEDWDDLGDECRGEGACGKGSMVCDAGGAATCCSAREGCLQDFAPGEEICDGIDNDCNGTPDDGLGIGEACPGEGRCQAGVWECDGPHGRRCSTLPGGSLYGGRPEICDGVDDDCDGATDEHAEGMGVACENGEGACRRGGFMACLLGVPTCDAIAGQPVDESCNVVDDDCDGEVDEDTAGLPCEVGLGQCANEGTSECRGGGVVCDAVAGEPLEEICDGLDNDCDGAVDDEDIDEGPLDGVGDACSLGVGPCERRGQTQCAGADGIVCNAVPADPEEEVCDGIDNDCDGHVDEPALPGIGEECTEGVGACAAPGRTFCGGRDGVLCDAQPGDPTDEICDGIDNDCNGEIDDVAALGGGAQDCGECANRCPVDDLPDDTQLCVALPGAGNCPEEWPDRIGPLSTGEVQGQLLCTPCDCGARVTMSFSRFADCSNDQVFRTFTCGSQDGGDQDEGGECDTGCEYRGTAPSHRATLEIIRWGGGERFDACTVEGGRTLRLCCKEELEEVEECGGPLCEPPNNSLGYVIQGDEFGVAAACGAAGGTAGTLKGGAEAVGQCLNCHCRAELTGRLCQLDATDSCVAAAHGATCETECLFHAAQVGDVQGVVPSLPRYVVNLDQDGQPPDTTEDAGCVATDIERVCDLDVGMFE